jgi:NAD(P)-dependent dehydrogenase (short-subunit alcohol dehydrogenase family)
MYDLSGKVALVTGTSNKRGLGASISLRLAKEGADVVVSDIYKPPEKFDPWDREEGWRGLDSLVAEIEALGRRSIPVYADITSSQEVNDVVKKAMAEFGKIDILVNNAGVVSRDLGKNNLVDETDEIWHKAISVNLTGVFFMCRAAVREMIARNQGGKVINISSVTGKEAWKGRASYSASKFGVVGMTQALALEVAEYNINVNAVCPGLVATWGSRGQAIYDAIKSGIDEREAIIEAYRRDGMLQQIPLDRPAMAEDVTNVVTFLASNQSDYMTGQAINVTGGFLMAH